jgi:hypothetical protein
VDSGEEEEGEEEEEEGEDDVRRRNERQGTNVADERTRRLAQPRYSTFDRNACVR